MQALNKHLQHQRCVPCFTIRRILNTGHKYGQAHQVVSIRHSVTNSTSMTSSSQSSTTATSLTSEQEETFRIWIGRHNWKTRPSLQTAADYLQLKYNQSFPSELMSRIIDDVYSERVAPPDPVFIQENPAEMETEPESAQVSAAPHNSKFKFPGYGLPTWFLPKDGEHFPILVGDQDEGWRASTLLIRELCMLKVMEDLTNKPEWWTKVVDPEIRVKWKNEMLSLDWEAFHEHADFTPKMADACIEELTKKARLYEETGLVPVFDYSACVVKSDNLMDDDLIKSLADAMEPLENVPEEEKDWHPGSDGKVLDIVHPSLWPLIYGRSRILPDKEITIDDCLNHVGMGEVVAKPKSERAVTSRSWGPEPVNVSSVNYQWLPCNVAVDDEGKAKITSYINNLHPIQHAKLYPIIEQFITKSLPAWDLVYRWPTEFEFQRLTTSQAGTQCTTPEACKDSYECRPTNRPVNDDEPPREEYEEDEMDYEESERGQLDALWFQSTHPQILPDATLDSDTPEKIEKKTSQNEYESSRKEQGRFNVTAGKIKKSAFFGSNSQLQVIVKLANIHLTPEKPTYDGGSWHIEGQRNEHICATALYYYDNENITDSRLAFRTSSNSEDLTMNLDYMQSDVRSIARTFAVEEAHEATTLQNIGSVVTRQGRAVFFPNLLQHQVQPFSLADPTRPGHRKILALFLVDPAIPIISTANIPPQQRPWWPAEDYIRNSNRLPPELAHIVLQNVDYVIDEEEAKAIREKLMSERTVMQTEFSEALQSVEFSFCEH